VAPARAHPNVPHPGGSGEVPPGVAGASRTRLLHSGPADLDTAPSGVRWGRPCFSSYTESIAVNVATASQRSSASSPVGGDVMIGPNTPRVAPGGTSTG